MRKKKACLPDISWICLRNLILLLLLLLNIFPLVWVFLSSFKSNREILSYALSMPQQFGWKNYLRVLEEPGMIRAYWNSIVITVISIILNVFVCFLAAYAINRFDFKFLKVIFMGISFGLLISVNSSVLPIKLIMDRMGLANSIYGLGILYAATQIPMSVIILNGHLSGISRTIDEAARIDGANHARVAFSIIAPIARPGVVTVIILQAVSSWNEFLFALTLISDQKYKTIQLIMRNFLGVFQSNYGALFASVVLAIVPMIIVFVLFQNRVIEAFTAGSVK